MNKKLLKALENNLDTRDKRFMFLQLMFPKHVSKIELEGSQKQCARNIYFHFEKQHMLGSLIACMNSSFNLKIYLEL